MSEKEKKNLKKKSRKLLSLPSFRKSKKLNQIKEDVCLDIKDETVSDISEITTSKHGSDNSLPSIGLEATVSLDSPRKGKSVLEHFTELGESVDTSTPNSERRSFSNLRSAYIDNPDLVINPLSPGGRRLDLGGSNNLSTDSGIDCSILLSEKGSPERFQAFTRREAERIRQEHLQSLSNLLPSQAQPEPLVNGSFHEADNTAVENCDDEAGASGGSSLQKQIEQTKEHISLLSELRTVLEQKLEACHITDNAVDTVSMLSRNETNNHADNAEIIADINGADSNTTGNRLVSLNGINVGQSPNTVAYENFGNRQVSLEGNNDGHSTSTSVNFENRHGSVGGINDDPSTNTSASENFNLYLHTNKTDERKSEEARMRLENNSSSFSNALLIDSPHLIVSPTPVVSTTATANHRILPSTPSPVRLYVNEKSAFAKCKSLRRSVSDVGKGLIGKFRQRKRTDCQNKTDRHSVIDDSSSGSIINGENQLEGKKDLYYDSNSSFSAHLETSLLCEDSDTDMPSCRSPSISCTWEMTDPNASIGSSYEIDFAEFNNLEPNISDRNPPDASENDERFKSETGHSQGSINTIQELTTSICEMTSKLKLTSSISADSIDCICNCRNRSDSPPCCDKSKPPSPIETDALEILNREGFHENSHLHRTEPDNTLDVVNADVDRYAVNAGDNQNNVEMTDSWRQATENGPVVKLVKGVSLAGENYRVRNNFSDERESTLLDNEENVEVENTYKETDCLLETNSEAAIQISPKADTEKSVSYSKVGIGDKSCYNGDLQKSVSSVRAPKTDMCNKGIKNHSTDIEKEWFCSDTEDDSSDDDSSVSYCSGCSDDNCSSKRNDNREKINAEADSSSGDTSPNDFNSSDKSSESDSDSSSLEGTPEELKWQNASMKNDSLSACQLPYSASFIELDVSDTGSPFLNNSITRSYKRLKCPINSPQSNFPSPEISFSPDYYSKTPASSPVSYQDGDEDSNNSPVVNGLSPSPSQRVIGCRRKDNYIDMSPETVINQTHNNQRHFGHNSRDSLISQSSNNSGTNLNESRSKQPDIIKDVPITQSLNMSLNREEREKPVRAKRTPSLWMDKHVGQVFSPAKRVLHKNRDLSETDLCKSILDSYISDAEESGFEPEFENSETSFMTCSNSLNSSVNTSNLFNNSLTHSSSFNTSLNSSYGLESGLSVDDSMLQYGTYVAPRRPKRETNVDDFSTTVVSSCYTAEAKTRKLQGGKYYHIYSAIRQGFPSLE